MQCAIVHEIIDTGVILIGNVNTTDHSLILAEINGFQVLWETEVFITEDVKYSVVNFSITDLFKLY